MKSANPLVGKYSINDLSIEILNERDSNMTIDSTDLIDDTDPSIFYDGANWIVDGKSFSTDKELYDYLFLDIEFWATKEYPDGEKMAVSINELEFNLIHNNTDTIWELKM